MPFFVPRLARVLSAGAIFLGVAAGHAAANETITLTPSNWVPQTGTWTFKSGRYVGVTGKKITDEAITVYNAVSGDLATFFGTVTVSVPLDPKLKLGDGFVLLRGKLTQFEDGDKTADGYFAGLSRSTRDGTQLVIFKRVKAADKLLCKIEVEPKNPDGPQKLEITVGGKTILVKNSGKSCKATDRSFTEGLFGFYTGQSTNTHSFKVIRIDMIAK
jgi:hypothetical protein